MPVFASVMVVPGLDPEIDAAIPRGAETDSVEGPWMAGSRPAMTMFPY
jgi:hypothetical protein